MWIFYTTKNAAGYNVDYALYNIVGFGWYSIYSWVGYFEPSTIPGIVDLSDMVFTLHGFAGTVVIRGQ